MAQTIYHQSYSSFNFHQRQVHKLQHLDPHHFGCGAWLSSYYKGLVSILFGSQSLTEGCEGLSLPRVLQRVQVGALEFFWENFVVKYCNFVVNLDSSLGRKSNIRIYVNLGSFALEGNPFPLWGNCIAARYYSVSITIFC